MRQSPRRSCRSFAMHVPEASPRLVPLSKVIIRSQYSLLSLPSQISSSAGANSNSTKVLCSSTRLDYGEPSIQQRGPPRPRAAAATKSPHERYECYWSAGPTNPCPLSSACPSSLCYTDVHPQSVRRSCACAKHR
jgi:hypothetical protein